MAAPKKRPAKARAPHPEARLRELQTSLEGGPGPAYLLNGEPYFRQRALEAILQLALERDWELCRHDTLDPDFNVGSLVDDLSGGALFASARCIVVRSADPLLKKTSRLYSAQLAKAIGGRVGDAAGEGTVILSCEAITAANPISKELVEAGGERVELRKLWDSPPPWGNPDPRRAELVEWLVGRAREMQVGLSPDDAVFVCAATGNDPSALEDRLADIGSRGEKAIREVIPWTGQSSPFEVADSLASGDLARAVGGLEALFQTGFESKGGGRTREAGGVTAMFFTALVGKVREAWRGAAALARGESIEAARKAAGVRGGPMAQRSFDARVSLRTPDEWAELLEAVSLLEARSRSGPEVNAADFCALALRFRRVPARR